MIGRFASTQADPQWVSNMKRPFELILVMIVLAVSIGASYAEPKKHHFFAARGERHRSHQLQQSNKNDGVGWAHWRWRWLVLWRAVRRRAVSYDY
jgi:hypothetical protein